MRFSWFMLAICLSFVFTWILLWLGTKVIDTDQGSWRNCAKIAATAYAAGFFGFIGALLGAVFNLDLIPFVFSCVAIVYLVGITMEILEIGVPQTIGLYVVVVLINWAVSWVLGMIGAKLPFIDSVVTWISR